MLTSVYKLGGSLLDLPDLGLLLDRLLQAPLSFAPANRPIRRLLIAGGGKTADVVREWDRQHAIGDERAHELALAAMSFNSRFIASLLPRGRLVRTREEAEAAWSQSRTAVLATAEFLDAEARTADRELPHSWNVTSDSIAADIALRWPACAVVLIKSIPMPRGLNPAQAAKQGAVDSHFATVATKISQLGWCDLRAPEPSVEAWTWSSTPGPTARGTGTSSAVDIS